VTEEVAEVEVEEAEVAQEVAEAEVPQEVPSEQLLVLAF